MSKRPLIKSVMTPFPHVIDASASITEARVMMEENDIRHLPVQHDSALVGLITERDLRLLLDASGRAIPPEEVRIGDVCEPDPFVVDRNVPLDEVLLTMANQRIGSALITRKGKLVGVFTVVDACRGYAELLRQVTGVGEDDTVA